MSLGSPTLPAISLKHDQFDAHRGAAHQIKQESSKSSVVEYFTFTSSPPAEGSHGRRPATATPPSTSSNSPKNRQTTHGPRSPRVACAGCTTQRVPGSDEFIYVAVGLADARGNCRVCKRPLDYDCQTQDELASARAESVSPIPETHQEVIPPSPTASARPVSSVALEKTAKYNDGATVSMLTKTSSNPRLQVPMSAVSRSSSPSSDKHLSPLSKKIESVAADDHPALFPPPSDDFEGRVSPYKIIPPIGMSLSPTTAPNLGAFSPSGGDYLDQIFDTPILPATDNAFPATVTALPCEIC